MCPKCQGLGHRKIQMQFMPAIQITCEECKGLRLNPVSLSIQYKGKNLGEFLQLSLVECLEYFSEVKKVKNLIDTFISIGLGYLKLGQEIITLSGGEAQRLRLGTELASAKRGETLYLIDEPTTGLHADDVAKLIKVFEGLLEKGHSLIVIEHHTDLIECADHLIDIGPGAGIDGGKVVFTGTPLEAKKDKKSITGKYLFA
jgi:excinuclease ABC subunit A